MNHKLVIIGWHRERVKFQSVNNVARKKTIKTIDAGFFVLSKSQFDWLTNEDFPLKSLSIVGAGELLGIATVTS